MLSLSPFQQGHRVDGEGQGVEGNLAYAFSLKPVEAVYYLFCFPLCKGGVFIDGNTALLPGWLGPGAGGGDTKCCRTRFLPYTLQIIAVNALTCQELCLHTGSHCDRKYRPR